jgi:myo-inositol-1(or 4)-monophosphatase
MKNEIQKIAEQSGLLLREVGKFIAEELGKVSNNAIEHKSLNSLVSYVDKTAEERLVAGCARLLPEAGFITEEETIATSADKEWRWIIDPLDGTTNFLHQLPFFSISVALQQGGKTVVGLVYEVNRQELFYAWKGGGCYLNGKSVKVSNTGSLADSLLATGFPYYDFEKTEAYLQLLGHLMPKTRGLRRLGSAALDLAYTACGRFDAFFEYSLAPWDVAAGAFLVEEAGGQVSDFSGGDDYLFGREMLATNAHLYPEMSTLLQQYFKR